MTNKKISNLATLTVIFRAVSLGLILILTALQKPLFHLVFKHDDLPFVFPAAAVSFAVIYLIGAIVLKLITKKEMPLAGVLILGILFIFIDSAQNYSHFVSNMLIGYNSADKMAALSWLTQMFKWTATPFFSLTASVMFYMTCGMCFLTNKNAKVFAIIDAALFGASLLFTLLITIFQKSVRGLFTLGSTDEFVFPYKTVSCCIILIILSLCLIYASHTKVPQKSAGIVSGLTYLMQLLLPIVTAIEVRFYCSMLGSEIISSVIGLQTIISVMNPVPIIAIPLLFFTAGIYFAEPKTSALSDK